MNERDRIQAVMPYWGHILTEADSAECDTLQEMAVRAIRLIDATLAPTSETCYLGHALADFSVRSAPTDQDILDNLAYWDMAYEAELQAQPGEDEDEDPERCEQVADCILSGDAHEALRIATN